MTSRRPIAALLCAAALALGGCASDGSVYERLLPLAQETVFGDGQVGDDPGEVPPPQLSRAELNEIPFATIALSIEDGPRAYVVPLADNGGYLVYQDNVRRGVVMHGGLITATHGLGYDLKAIKHARGDPVAVPTPLIEWPGGIQRSYRFSLNGRDDYQIAVGCVYERSVRELIEIVELRYEVVRIIETCANNRRRFVNTYWVDPETGFIWKAEQWLGPRLPPMTVEILRPYSDAI